MCFVLLFFFFPFFPLGNVSNLFSELAVSLEHFPGMRLPQKGPEKMYRRMGQDPLIHNSHSAVKRHATWERG